MSKPVPLKTQAMVATLQYIQALQANPLRTKAITSAVLNIISDLIAQTIQLVREEDPKKKRSIDLLRTFKFALFGALVSAPFFHYWYDFVNKFFKGMKGESVYIYKIMADRFIAAPIFFTLFYLWTALWTKPQEHWIPAVSYDVKTKLPSTIINSLYLWVPAQYYNFKFVPVLFRVLFGNLVSLVWNIYFSLKNN